MEWKVSYSNGNSFEDFLGSSTGELLVSMVILVIIMSAIALCIVLPYIHKKQKALFGTDDKNKYETVTVDAKLISKTENPVNNGIGTYASMIFELENGNRLEFKFPNLYNYSHMIIGDKGKLSYAGRAFINFEHTK